MDVSLYSELYGTKDRTTGARGAATGEKAPLTMADLWLAEKKQKEESVLPKVDALKGGGDGRTDQGAKGTANSTAAPASTKATDTGQKPASPAGRTRTLENVYADMDEANKSYAEYEKKLSSTDPNVLRAALYYTAEYGNEIKDLKREERALLDAQRGHKMSTGETLGYSFGRAGAGLLGLAKDTTDLIGGGLNRAAQGMTSLFGLAPNMLSDWFGEGARKFEDNSATKKVEEGLYQKYLPTRDQQNITKLRQVALDVAVPTMAMGKVERATEKVMDAVRAAKTGISESSLNLERVAGKAEQMYNAGKEAAADDPFLQGFYGKDANAVQDAEKRIADRAKESAKESFDIAASPSRMI